MDKTATVAKGALALAALKRLVKLTAVAALAAAIVKVLRGRSA